MKFGIAMEKVMEAILAIGPDGIDHAIGPDVIDQDYVFGDGLYAFLLQFCLKIKFVQDGLHSEKKT